MGDREGHVFVVRVWREGAPPLAQWRATVEDLAAGHRIATTDLRDIEDFIRLRILGDESPPRG